MPSTAHRAANKASGVNGEVEYYCDSNLNLTPLNQSASATEDPSLTLRHNHNQAHGDTNNGASANTNSPGVRSSKRGRGFAKKQHGNSKRRATNVCPGSAVSSSNANAAGTGPVEDECDNKENCPPVEESWHQPSLEESWPTPLKSTLVVLDKCLIPADARRAVIKLFIADKKSINKVESAILKWLTVLGGDDKGKTFKGEVGVSRRRLAKVLGRVANGKYRGRVNLGDVLQELVSVIILKHYAPYSCKGYTDGGEYNLIDRDNVCIKAFHLLIARSLHKEGGGVWTDDVAKSVNDNIAFTDLRVILPNKKDTHQKEFTTFAKDCGISPGLSDLIGFLSYASQAKYHYLLHGTPVKVVVASAECNRVWFDERARTVTPYVIFLAYVPHGQCWAMRLPLMNPFVHRDEMLPRYNERLVAAYEGIVVTPAKSMIAHRFGARTGNDLGDDELIAKMELMRQWCVKGGNVTKDAWKAVFGGTATEYQEQLVYDSHFYKNMMAWAAFNDGHIDADQMAFLEKQPFYKLKMAKKAEKEGHADDVQLALIETFSNGKNWDEYFEELTEFKKTRGHCNVLGDEGRGLARWVSIQRTEKVKLDLGKPTYLTPERVRILEDLGFDWKPENSRILNQISNTNNGSILQKNQTQGKKNRKWSREEDCLLMKAHFLYGKNWVSVASMVETRTYLACTNRARTLLPEHSYIGTPKANWYYTVEDGNVYGPFSNDVMNGWAMQGCLTGDMAIGRNSTGPFGPAGMFFVDRSKAFSSTDEVTDNVKERNTLIEGKAVNFWAALNK